MFWVSDLQGRFVGVSGEWLELFDAVQGNQSSDGIDILACTRASDVDLVRRFLNDIQTPQGPLSIVFHLRQTGTSPIRLLMAGLPALSPETGDFRGYVGRAEVVGVADGETGDGSASHRPVERETYLLDLNRIADAVLAARQIAQEAGDSFLLKVLDFALITTGERIAQHTGLRSA